MKFNSILILLLLLSQSVLAQQVVLAPESNFIAGMVVDADNKKGLSDVNVIIIYKHRKLFSLRTSHNGWFETPYSLEQAAIINPGEKITSVELRVQKKGYKYLHTSLSMKDYKAKITNNNLQIDLVPYENYRAPEVLRIYFQSKHGYIHNSKDEPVNGAVVKVYMKDKGGKCLKDMRLLRIINVSGMCELAPVASAVSRKSGFFTLYYQDVPDDMVLNFNLEHYLYDTRDLYQSMGDSNKLLIFEMEQDIFSWSLGMGLGLQTTGTVSDRESGGVLSLNLTRYNREILVVNRLYPRYKRNGIAGWEVSLGWIPYRDTKTGEDEVGDVYVLGAGVVYAWKYSPVLARLGVSTSKDNSKAGSERNTAVYFGVNFPFLYF